MRPSLSDISLGELGRGVVRMSPFIGAAGAALLLLVMPPHEHTRRGEVAAPASSRYVVPSLPGSSGNEQAAAEAAPPASPSGLIASAIAPLDTSTTTGSSTIDLNLTATVAAGPAATAPSDARDVPPDGAGSLASSPSPLPPTPAAVTASPLTVSAKAWASREAGTPAAATGVPDGTLPVGNRLGQVDKASFVRLQGTATVLTLLEDTDGSRAVAGPGIVQACPVTAEWSEADAMSLDQAPAYDSTRCVSATAAPDNTWSFDLSGYSDRGSGQGFALVPAPDAPVDFQVTFRVG